MSEDLKTSLTPDEAAAAIEAAAWTERPGDEAYRAAVEALTVMLGDKPGPFAADEIRAVISEHVPEPRRLIHSRTICGADWYADAAVKFAREPGAVSRWVWDLCGHDLQITSAAGRAVRFEARAPGPIRSQLAAQAKAAPDA